MEQIKPTEARDSHYGSRVRRLEPSDGHEHNLYHYRDPWNADGTQMVGVRSNLQQQDWRVLLYKGNGVFIKELWSIATYDWKLVWDRHLPDILYTWREGNLYKYDVTTDDATLLMSFEPMRLQPPGPSLNQDGSRILVFTNDGIAHSFRLPDMTDERRFDARLPDAFSAGWDKARYIGYDNLIVINGEPANSSGQAMFLFDDTGELAHRLDGHNVGHHDFSPDGRFAYFNWIEMWEKRVPLELRIVNLDGTDERILLRVPSDQLAYVHNLHLSWPRRVNDWFIASFFPNADNLPCAYRPYVDEIAQVRIDGTWRFLVRTGTMFSPGMFWAQPVAAPSADGRRISFNSVKSGTIDHYILDVRENRSITKDCELGEDD
ncbi:MAG: hypothetical protein O3A46_09015 [Candidatus Poribacteria bacterium]|nr:hypothetical protein [Candidatus Poribacteria bacterium]